MDTKTNYYFSDYLRAQVKMFILMFQSSTKDKISSSSTSEIAWIRFTNFNTFHAFKKCTIFINTTLTSARCIICITNRYLFQGNQHYYYGFSASEEIVVEYPTTFPLNKQTGYKSEFAGSKIC